MACGWLSTQQLDWSLWGCALVQELISAHPGLVASAVGDLSAGGALPLHLAAAGGCVDVVQALLAVGAPLEAKHGKGLTALQVGGGCTGMQRMHRPAGSKHPMRLCALAAAQTSLLREGLVFRVDKLH